MTTRTLAYVLATAVLLTLVGLLGAPPAAAETACADVWIYTSGNPPTYIPGPTAGNCVATPFGRLIHLGADTDQNWLPPGTPSGAGFDVWVTAP